MDRKITIWRIGLFLLLCVFHWQNTDAIRPMSLPLEENSPFDSTKVYSVKYLNGSHAGKFLGVNVFGTDTLLLDAVYGHIPDGQFVVCRENTWMLRSRAGNVTLAEGGYTGVSDSMQTVAVGGVLLDNQYTNGTDTFDIVAFANGSVNLTDARIGYKYFMPEELNDKVYTISYHSTDALNRWMLGYRAVDSLTELQSDTTYFLFTTATTKSVAGSDIANIAALEKTAYRIRSFHKPQLYVSIRDDSIVMDEVAYATSFYLKKDTTRNLYALIDANEAFPRKMFTQSNRRLYMSPLDSIDTHWYEITAKAISVALPTEFIVDTARIYKVKYMSKPDSGKYLGADMFGYKKLFDTVYAHIPDAQFVVRRQNKFTLNSRVGMVRTGRYDTQYEYYNYNDSLKVVIRDGVLVENQFTNTIDTFEIVAIDYGDIKRHQTNPYLGYKYFTQQELTEKAFAFFYQSNDTLHNGYIDYKDVNLPCILMSDGIDTARYVAQASFDVFSEGADAIGAIPKLRRRAYRFYSASDSLYYLRMHDTDSIIMMRELQSVSDTKNHFFYLKDDTIPDTENYNLIIKTEFLNGQAKMFVNDKRQIYMDPLDSLHTHVFKLVEKERYATEADPYTYMKQLLQGSGLYEISTTEIDGSGSFLARNFYNSAVFRKEGESTLRAGSYTPADFHLWVDSTRGPESKPDRPSFFIVRDVDTLKSKFNISGYFLHVMDSSAVSPNTDNIVTVDGKLYNRVNFVQATRASANELLLDTTATARARDSVGFAGKNEKAINEFRFYFQQSSQVGKYYIVSEQDYGGKQGIRGYLTANKDGILYFGPREGALLPVTISLANMVKNEAPKLPPIVVQEVEEGVTVTGVNGVIQISHGAGQHVTIYNVVGQQIANRTLDSDYESIPAQRGIAIVRIEHGKTYKVVVK